MVDVRTDKPAPSTTALAGRAGAEPVVTLRGVSKSFGRVTVLRELDLDVQRGEILTLLGPSGCGKTTTLRLIIGLERSSEGEISYEGEPSIRRKNASSCRLTSGIWAWCSSRMQSGRT